MYSESLVRVCVPGQIDRPFAHMCVRFVKRAPPGVGEVNAFAANGVSCAVVSGSSRGDPSPSLFEVRHLPTAEEPSFSQGSCFVLSLNETSDSSRSSAARETSCYHLVDRDCCHHGEATRPARISESVRTDEALCAFHNPRGQLNMITGPGRDRWTHAPEYMVTAVRVRRLAEGDAEAPTGKNSCGRAPQRSGTSERD